MLPYAKTHVQIEAYFEESVGVLQFRGSALNFEEPVGGFAVGWKEIVGQSMCSHSCAWNRLKENGEWRRVLWNRLKENDVMCFETDWRRTMSFGLKQIAQHSTGSWN